MKQYDEVFYPSDDGLTLYARDYNRAEEPPLTLLCLHGLTRNSADFEGLADQLSGRYRLVVADQRGRGKSDYAVANDDYNLMTYVQDMWTLLAHLNIDKVAIIGTSMGGLMAILMALEQRDRICGLVLNDIGPEVDPEGVARIASYAGKGGCIDTWDEAVQQTKAINGPFFPDFTEADWLRVAQAGYRKEPSGRLCPAYDPNVTQSLSFLNKTDWDLWPLFEATGPIHTLALRGRLSDLLSDSTLQEMQRRHPRMVQVTVDNRGHAPFLTEPDALSALNAFLAGLEEQADRDTS
ncbi:alpha/beta fold hydrolase [Paremcibacter congregatus]|uniref:alpha/beta fold hydrolase n=1 Tax=Paremcibacter congregatus TaxID=2043170 RepID=UPI003A9348A8